MLPATTHPHQLLPSARNTQPCAITTPYLICNTHPPSHLLSNSLPPCSHTPQSICTEPHTSFLAPRLPSPSCRTSRVCPAHSPAPLRSLRSGYCELCIAVRIAVRMQRAAHRRCIRPGSLSCMRLPSPSCRTSRVCPAHDARSAAPPLRLHCELCIAVRIAVRMQRAAPRRCIRPGSASCMASPPHTPPSPASGACAGLSHPPCPAHAPRSAPVRHRQFLFFCVHPGQSCFWFGGGLCRGNNMNTPVFNIAVLFEKQKNQQARKAGRLPPRRRPDRPSDTGSQATAGWLRRIQAHTAPHPGPHGAPEQVVNRPARRRPLPGASLRPPRSPHAVTRCAHTTCHCSYARPRCRSFAKTALCGPWATVRVFPVRRPANSVTETPRQPRMASAKQWRSAPPMDLRTWGLCWTTVIC